MCAKNDMTAVQMIDQLFLQMFEKFTEYSINSAAKSTEEVFKLSSSFLSKPATDLLREFQALYFAPDLMQKKKEDINKGVDNLIEQVNQQLDETKQEIVLEEDKEQERERLQLATLQKRIEALISMDHKLRRQIIPAMASMQFEDAVRQRLGHILDAWKITMSFIESEHSDLEDLLKKLAALPSSIAESEIFYPIVLKQDPPQGAAPETALFF